MASRIADIIRVAVSIIWVKNCVKLNYEMFFFTSKRLKILLDRKSNQFTRNNERERKLMCCGRMQLCFADYVFVGKTLHNRFAL
jgi:hypothetical protein